MSETGYISTPSIRHPFSDTTNVLRGTNGRHGFETSASSSKRWMEETLHRWKRERVSFDS